MRTGGDYVMPRTRTTFQPGHKGMGGRPKGSRNRAKEDWRAAQRRAQEVGAICDALLAELAKPKRRNRMKARQWARVLKVITTRQKSHLARSQHVRPVVPTGRRPLDRKSTRLNSSHRCISYAVFCLKKKKQK